MAGNPIRQIAEDAAERVVQRWWRKVPTPRWGEITSTAPLEVQLAGDTTATPVALVDAGYTPALGDRVWLLPVGHALMVGGKVVSS